MLDETDRKRRLAIVTRIAVGMAGRSNDPILAKTQILTTSTFQGNPKSEEELERRNPVAIQADGGRYFPHVRMDGRGQLDIAWPSGVEKTIKFWIPEEYLSEDSKENSEVSSPRLAPSDGKFSNASHSELKAALLRMKKVDSRVPTTISGIPGFPFTDFAKMQEAIREGKFALAKFSFHQDAGILGLVSPGTRLLYTTSMLLTFIVPLASIALAFTVSHWYWLGLLYFFWGSRFTSSIWKNSILKAAFQSEPAFCLLFYTSKINAYDLTNPTEYEWQQLTAKS